MWLSWRAEECPKCGKPFRVTGGGGGPFQEREPIDCPYCGATLKQEKTAGVYYTHKLTDEEAADYEQSKKK